MNESVQKAAQKISETFVQMFLLIGHDQKEAQEFAGLMLLQIFSETLAILIENDLHSQQLEKELLKTTSLEQVQQFLADHFDFDTYISAMEQATKKVVGDYFAKVAPEMTPQHKLILQAFAEIKREEAK